MGCAACSIEWNVMLRLVHSMGNTGAGAILLLSFSVTSRQKGTLRLRRPLTGSGKARDGLECPCCSDAASKALSRSSIWTESLAYLYRCHPTDAL